MDSEQVTAEFSRQGRLRRLFAWLMLVTAIVAVLLFVSMLAADHPEEVQRLRAHLAQSVDWLMWGRFSLYALVVFVVAPGMARNKLEQKKEPASEGDRAGREDGNGTEKTLPSRSILSLQLQLLAAAVAVELLVVQNGLAVLSDWMWG